MTKTAEHLILNPIKNLHQGLVAQNNKTIEIRVFRIVLYCPWKLRMQSEKLQQAVYEMSDSL